MNRKQIEAKEKKDVESLEKALTPKQTLADFKEKALLILPQIVNKNKDSDQGLIDVAEMRSLLKILHNRAYNLRKGLIRELHKDNDRLLKEISLMKADK